MVKYTIKKDMLVKYFSLPKYFLLPSFFIQLYLSSYDLGTYNQNTILFSHLDLWWLFMILGYRLLKDLLYWKLNIAVIFNSLLVRQIPLFADIPVIICFAYVVAVIVCKLSVHKNLLALFINSVSRLSNFSLLLRQLCYTYFVFIYDTGVISIPLLVRAQIGKHNTEIRVDSYCAFSVFHLHA